MRLIYPVLMNAMPFDKRCMVARLVASAFDRDFRAEQLLGFEKAVLCQENGRVIGVACVRNSGRHRLPTLECVCVSHDFRRKGIGRELVQSVQTELDYDGLLLHVDRDSSSSGMRQHNVAVGLYESCGFVSVREDERETEMEWRRGGRDRWSPVTSEEIEPWTI